jgi:Zn-dependent protease with chaperone function
MPFIKQIRTLSLVSSALIGGYLSLKFVGGLLVFGGRTKNLLEVCFVYPPVFAFPVAVLALWNSRWGASLWLLLMLVFFVPQLLIDWPRIHVTPVRGTSFPLFLVVAVLLMVAAMIDQSSRQKKEQQFAP